MDPSLCRICLCRIGTISIFTKNEDVQYSCKIMRCVNITVAEGDGLPHTICVECIMELNISYEFVQKCEASDKALRCLAGAPSFPPPYAPRAELEPLSEQDIKNELDIKDELDFINYDSDHLLNSLSKEDYSDTEQLMPKSKKKKSSTKESEFNHELVKNGVQHEIDQFNDILEKFSKKACSKAKSCDREKRKRTKRGPVKCEICGLVSVCQSAQDTHMRTHTGEKPFHCLLCSSQFRTKGALKNHIESRHSDRERKFTCETCGNSFYRKNDIIIHMRVHTNEKPYVCSYCSQGFRQIATLIRHRRIHTGEKPYACSICDKKFSDKHLVKKHLLVHSDEKKFQCHLCSKSMKSRSALNTHLNLHSNQKQNICSFCGMAFNVKGNLQTHIRRMHSEKSGQCSVCLKTFSDLEEHMRKHTGEKPYVCKLCDQGFATKRSLTQHTAFKHENVAKFKCSIGECARTFPTAMMLEFHLLKQHTNNTPYVCQHCSRGFFRPSDLSRHLRVSHMDIQLKIPIKPDTS